MRIGSWMSRSSIAAIAALMALNLGGVAAAGTISQSFAVTATIATTCAFGTINALAFGAYDPLVTNASSGTDLAGSTTFNIDCVNGIPVSVGLDNGLHASGGQRYMTAGGGNNLTYTLFQDAAHNTAWSNTAPLAVTGTGSAQTISVYAIVAKGQNEPIGSYADTVTITLTY